MTERDVRKGKVLRGKTDAKASKASKKGDSSYIRKKRLKDANPLEENPQGEEGEESQDSLASTL